MKQPHLDFTNKRRWCLRVLLAGAMALHLLLPDFGFALDPSKSVFQYNCRSWTRQDGLPANGVSAIAQTKDGYLWLGTIAGPVRFDGINFDLIDLSKMAQFRATETTGLSASESGGLWFGINNGGVAFIDGKNVSLMGAKASEGMIRSISSLVESKGGDLFVTSQGQAGRVRGGTNYETILPPPGTNTYYDVRTVYQDSQGRVWFGTTKAGLYFWQDGVLSKFPDPALDDTGISAVVVDQQGVICVATQFGLARYDSQFHRLPGLLTTMEIRALLVDRHGILWAGTTGSGLFRFQNDVATQFRKTDGLADDFVTALAEDKEGNLWVGTRNGLSQLSDVKIPIFGKTEGLTADVDVSVAPSRRGGIWVATSSGFTHFDGGTNIQVYSSEVGLTNTYIITMLEAKNGDIYLINGDMEILVFSGGKIVARYPNKDYPTALVEDAQGVVAAANGMLYRVSASSISPYLLADGQQAAPGYLFNMITGKDGSIWIANAGQGIMQVKDGSITNWALGSGNGDPPGAFSVYEDDEGAVWATSTTGIARLKDGHLKMITKDDGLFDNVIYTMVLDDHDRFWLDSARGIVSVTRQALNDFADSKIDHVECVVYDSLNDVKSVDRNQQKLSGCKSLDGRIWFPTAQGVLMIDPTNLARNFVPPPVHIDAVLANGKVLGKATNAVVQPGKGELEFQYVGLSYIAPLKVQYRYKLDGYDKDWVDAGNRRSAFYTNLKPGPYHFQVQAGNEDGVWNTAGDEFSLRLLPHYYQTVWFIALIGSLAGIGLFGLYIWRVRHMRWKQKKLQEAHDLLETKVAKRTAELKTEIEERKRMQAEVEKTHHQLLDISHQAGMAEVATGVLHNVGNVLNSVNISSSCLAENLKKSKAANLSKVVALLHEHEANLGGFLNSDPKGRQLPAYLAQLAQHLAGEQADALAELAGLQRNIDHIKEIVAMQQSYAKVSGVTQRIKIEELVEEALRMNENELMRHAVQLVREYDASLPEITVDKHKVIQILVNLVRNGKQACTETKSRDKRIIMRVANGAGRIKIFIIDNGVGIPPENLTRIFNHGFTTRKDGHGFGLHSSALAAKEMGGSLTVHSDGPGKGATFTLELPCTKNEDLK
jgi:ligand-binding sensor domain-containing protein/signal transduction histidine kinase